MILDDTGRKELGLYIKGIREKAGLARNTVSFAIGLKHDQYLKMVELGLREPSIKLVKSLCTLAKFSPAKFADKYGELLAQSVRRQLKDFKRS